MTGIARELPRYKCHKEVWALKIAEIEWLDDGRAIITPTESGYAPFEVDSEFTRRNDIKPGWYYVVYKGGYRSASPADAFEDGYTRI